MHFIMSIAVILTLALSSVINANADESPLRIFLAANFNPVIKTVKADAQRDLGLALMPESSGSQVACRKVAELGRECDVLILADPQLFTELVPKQCPWRITFGCDRMVLGVGRRAKRSDDAEKDWPAVILDPAITVGRVDENLAPSGYRTLLLLKLKDSSGKLLANVIKKTDRKCDDVAALAALLRNGDIEYGFLYRSACLNYDIRFIELGPAINMGHSTVDYSTATVSFKNTKNADVTIKGSPISYGLSIPSTARNGEGAVRFIRYLLTKRAAVLTQCGIEALKPKFHGPKDSFTPFAGFCDYAGDQ